MSVTLPNAVSSPPSVTLPASARDVITSSTMVIVRVPEALSPVASVTEMAMLSARVLLPCPAECVCAPFRV